MSNAQSLKDCITEYRKANKGLDNKLTEIEEKKRLNRKVQEGQSIHRN